MNGKRSPFSRDKNRFVLQERDKNILTALFQYGFLTNEQVKLLFNFGCLTRINIRLRKLYDNQYISRVYLNNFYGRSKTLHFIGPEAVGIVSEKLGIDGVFIRKKRKKFLAMKESALQRRLLLNCLRIAVICSIRRINGVKLESWKINRQVQLKMEQSFYPDVHFCYKANDSVLNLFIDIDNPSKNLTYYKERIDKYFKYGMDGYFEKQFGFRFFRVLIVCSSKTRLSHIRETIQRKTDKMFWLTTWDRIGKDNFFDSIWDRPNKDGLFSLLEDRKCVIVKTAKE